MKSSLPSPYTKVYQLPEGMDCDAEVVGKIRDLPRRMKIIVRLYWWWKWVHARSQGIHLFNGVIYSAEPQFDWAKKKIKFLLYETTFAHLVARWLSVGDTRVVPDFEKFVTCPVLLVTKPTETEEKCFIFGLINSNRLNGSSINFVGGTMDKKHTAHSHPLEANFMDESEEEVGILPEHVEHWTFKYLAETEVAYFLVPEVHLKLTSTQMDEHFQRFTERDTEKEITKIIKVPATQEGVLDFIHRNKNKLTRPMVEVLLVAVGLEKPSVITNAA
ncbi:hypothetical protein [Shimazuella kribbensis]|uniref:hypothetical protein n=1 Tax=Shimazuella kribbensis TaxID=139808 RepID=UPI0004266CAA|nr:hypothetical protein [Shimazuella kribbensis]